MATTTYKLPVLSNEGGLSAYLAQIKKFLKNHDGLKEHVSEIAKKSSFLAAIIISIPLTSLLAFIWLYWDTKDIQKVVDLSYGTIVMTIPSFFFFIELYCL